MEITRAHLKNAVLAQNADLLDKLLEQDASHLNDNNYFTDDWGAWWGLLFEATLLDWADGVRVLLKHGADRNQTCWGDCMELTPLEAAKEHRRPRARKVLAAAKAPTYTRRTDPRLPALSEQDQAVNRQGEIADETGLQFNVD